MREVVFTVFNRLVSVANEFLVGCIDELIIYLPHGSNSILDFWNISTNYFQNICINEAFAIKLNKSRFRKINLSGFANFLKMLFLEARGFD